AGQLHIGIIPTIAPFVLPRLLPWLKKHHPKLELNVTEDLTENIYQRLMLGKLDVLLLALPYELASTQTLALFEDDFYLACNNKTQFVSDPEHYSLSKIKNEAIVLLQDGHCLTEHAIDACQIKRSDKISHISPSTLQTLVQMINSDLGVSFLPALSVESNMLKNTHINVYKMAKRAYREIGLAWRQGSGREAEFALLGQRVCEAMKK
ncbi:MAG: LysR substrate-binding domain-containing protein, partial [Pseudomonadales bacterium]